MREIVIDTETTGLSIKDGHLLLGTWQGLFLFEHRLAAQKRIIIHHYIGD